MVSKSQHSNRSPCPLARGLDIIGDHWTLLVVRDLMLLGRHEYGQMLEGDEAISSNILSDRLRKLQQQGLVAQITHPQNKRKKLYYLTPKGKDLIPVLLAIFAWSNKHLKPTIAMPREMRSELAKGADHFTQYTLGQLQRWEQEHNTNVNTG